MPVNASRSREQGRIPSKQFPKFLRDLIWIYAWSKKQAIRKVISKLYSPIGYIGLAALGIEIILEVFHLTGWFRDVSHVTAMVVMALLLMMAWYKKRELQEHRRHVAFLESAHFAVTSLDRLALDPGQMTEASAALTGCVEEILGIILDTFAWKGSLNVNVMLPEKEGESVALVMRFVRANPGVEYDEKFRPVPGQGGAGLCFQEKAIVYLPDFSKGHGVLVRPANGGFEHTVCLDIYQKVSEQFANYRSILSVPVAAYHNCFGVLNLDSRLRDPFTEKDYFAVAFFGAIIALAFSRYQSYYPNEL